MTSNHRARRSATAGAGLALALTLAACGGNDTTSDAGEDTAIPGSAESPTQFNDADVEFASDMIVHHAQAIEMSILAEGRPLDPEVEQLVADVKAAQVPEVETMSDWLSSWGEEIPATSMDHSNAGHDMEMPDMPGMMSAEEMEALENASDSEFQDLWLQMMIEHHEGAVEMALTEQEDGVFPEAVDLAESIESTQREEIETMEGLLG